MGCDIHLYVEKKVDGKWVSAETWDNDNGYVDVNYYDRFYSGRNYDLFAILADVRNGHGFAGCDTGEGFNPISQPRGLPEDVSPEVKNHSDRWGLDGHSHSWFTVVELLQYDWTQRTKNRGWVSGPGFLHWIRHRRGMGLGPDGYCGGVGGQGIEHISAEEMEKLVSKITGDAGRNYQEAETAVREELGKTYCKVEWEVSYHQQCGHFWSNTIPKLLALGLPEDVRIVFWFDN